MDLQKVATYGTAAAVVGTGTIIGGNVAIDNVTGGPEKRIKAKQTELQLIVREEVRSAIAEMMPTSTGGVVRIAKPGDYRKEVPK
mgnify:FL=1|tara:strand:- start:31 stop:285 length:255 start_codon:yes stop_codon:yes gene_type:complete